MATNQQNGNQESRSTSKRGFASMDPNKRREIARKGGLSVSRNKEHMASIGRKGGETISRDRQHMSEIGERGGRASHGGGRKPKQDSQEPEAEA